MNCPNNTELVLGMVSAIALGLSIFSMSRARELARKAARHLDEAQQLLDESSRIDAETKALLKDAVRAIRVAREGK